MATRSTAPKRPSTGRFTPSGRPSAQRPAGRRSSAAPSRRSPIVARRRPPQKSGIAKLVEGVAGALPGAGAKNKRGGGGAGKGGTTAGLAMLAGAAGLAFKNRDKLRGMLGGGGSGTGDRTAHADAPANPVVITEPPRTGGAPAAGPTATAPGDDAAPPPPPST